MERGHRTMAESDSDSTTPSAPEGELRDLSDPAVRETIAQKARTAAKLSMARKKRRGELDLPLTVTAL